jgi:hypothetical protein
MTRRHPDVRRLMRKIELLKAEAAQERDAPGSGAKTSEEESRPIQDLPRAVVPIADGDERPLGIGEEVPGHWLQRAPRYSLWVEAQSQAAQARVTLDAREQVLESRKKMHARLAKQVTELERARLEEQELLAQQQEEEALRVRAANELPPVHEPLLIVEQARVIHASTPWRFFLPLTLVAGLLALLAAYLVELQDRSFHSPGEVTRRASLPVLGVIPHLRGR